MKEDPRVHDGPGAEINPVLEKAHALLVHELKRAGLDDTIFAIVTLMPRASDKAGHDVVRVCANLNPDEVHDFLWHCIRDEAPPENPKVKVLSLKQAMKLVDLIRADAEKPAKKEQH